MKQAVGFASKILFYAMIGVLLILNASYTMGFVGKMFPDDWIKIWGSLILFDAGAIIWFLIFLTRAEGAGQRGVSLLMGAFDLVGSLIIAGAEVFGAAQEFLTDPAMTAWLQETATYVLFIWLGVNIAMTWIFHVMDPKQQEAMKARAIQDEITAKALEMAGSKIDRISSAVADELSEEVTVRVLASLGVQRNYIDAPFHDAPRQDEKPKPTSNGVGALKHAFNAVTRAADKATRVSVGTATDDEPKESVTDSGNGVKAVDPTKRRRG